MPDLKNLPSFKAHKPLRLGLDIDGTITAAPDFFVALAERCLAAGGEVHIVSSRSPSVLNETEKELRALGLRYSAVYLLPPISTAQSDCPHGELDWFQRYLWQKIDYSLRQGITHFFDDEEKVLSLFGRYAPKIEALHVNQRHAWIAKVPF